MRASKGDLPSQKVVEGNKERLYVFLDREEERVPEPFREKYMRSLEERVKTLEDEVYRQQARGRTAPVLVEEGIRRLA